MNKIQEISQRSKGQILERLKQAHKDSNFIKQPSIDPIAHIQSSEDMLEELKRKMIDNKYIVEECAKDMLEDKINAIVAEYGYNKMIYGKSLALDVEKIHAKEKVCFDKEIENLRSEVFHSAFSVIQARCGVSSHGVALVYSSNGQPRTLSLTPTLCIMFL